MFSIILFVSLIFGIFVSANTHLIDADKYTENVAQRMMEHFEQAPNSNELMIMKDFNRTISTSRFGLKADGTVRFHSGFVMSIDGASLDNRTHSNAINDDYSRVEATFALRGVQIVYDVKFELTNYTSDGTYIIKHSDVRFDMTIIKKHNSEEVEGKIQFTGTNGQGQKYMEIAFDPDNGYTQLLGREIKQNSTFREPMNESFKEWNTALQAGLTKAVQEIDFPKIDYYK